jgi:streptogrisin C
VKPARTGLRRVLALAAAGGVAFATAFAAVPASAEPANSTAAGTTTVGLKEAGLAEAVLRDLGLSPEEFNAAGELGKQAAGVAAALRTVPGYSGTRLQDGRILVTGTGAELADKVAELAGAFPSLTLEAPAAGGKEGPAAGGKELAVSTQQLYEAYLREVGPEGLQAVAYSGGKFVIRAGGLNAPESTSQDAAPGSGAGSADGKLSAAEFVSRFANVELDGGADLAPEADVVGGQGYFADLGGGGAYICSTGFSAFDPAGLPTVLTAGHCTGDGAAQEATLEFPQLNRAGLLGTFGFNQFGGPGNSHSVGTDVAVIGSIRADLDPEPAASTWNDPSQAGPDVKIIGTAAPVVGLPVCRSGRTTAWSCGTIDEVGIYLMRGPNFQTDRSDLRPVLGFLSYDVQSSGGDSGGPWVSGNYALGIHSGGEDIGEARNFAIAGTLDDATQDDALGVLPGYQLELFLNKPLVTSPGPGGTFEAGQTVAGQVPAAPASAVAAGSKVRITVDGQPPFEVPLDAAGNWSFVAPETTGALRFSAETVNGFSVSGASDFVFEPAVPATAPPATGPSAPESPAPQTPGSGPAAPDPAPAPPAEPVPPAESPAPPQDGAVLTSGDVTAVGQPPVDGSPSDGNDRGDGNASLANTGVSGLIMAAGLAAGGAIVIGGVLTVVARRRKKRRTP